MEEITNEDVFENDKAITNEEVFERFGFIIQDAEFKKNYMHLLTIPFLGKWIEIFGEPSEYGDEQEYYLRLAFGLVGQQISDSLRIKE